MTKENLYDDSAKAKIKDLAESIDFAMMATNLSHKPIHTIPMSTKKVDDQGNIWFLSGADSEHNRHIQQESDVQLMYSDPGSMEFLIVFGQATISKDQAILKELYGPTDDNWFDGENDPKLTAICFAPQEGHYWDSKSNSLVTMFKMGIGAITGNEQDIGREGSVKM